MKLIYVCSPYRGEVRRNIENAKKHCMRILEGGNVPLCVHLFLNEMTGLSEKKGDRNTLLELGKLYVRMADELWVFPNPKVSEGMIGEIKLAEKMRKKVLFFKEDEDD